MKADLVHEIPLGAALRDRSAAGRGVWCGGLVPHPAEHQAPQQDFKIPAEADPQTSPQDSEFSEVATDTGSLKQLPTPVQHQHWEPLGD